MPSTARGPFLNSRTSCWVSIAGPGTPPRLAGLRAGQVRQVLDALHALHLPGPGHQLVHQLAVRQLAAEVDHAVLHVQVDLVLGDLVVPEDLALDLLGQRGIVEALLGRWAAHPRCGAGDALRLA